MRTTTFGTQREFDQLDAERAQLLAKANDGTITPQEVERADAVVKRLGEVRESLARQEGATKALMSAGLGVSVEDSDQRPGAVAGMPNAAKHAAALGKFTAATVSAFKAADPVTGGVSKALVPSGSVTVDYVAPPVVEPRAAFFLSSALSLVTVDQPTGAYLRQTERDNQAAPVSLGQLKPTSSYGFEFAKWAVATLAHLSEPLPRQWLSDFTGMQAALVGELGYGLALALDNYLLNGGTAEDGTTTAGILTATGVLEQDHVTDGLTTTRHAIGLLEEGHVAPTAFVLHPRDWRDLELARESGGKFLLAGAPQDRPSRDLWGIPVILSTTLTPGQALVGDLRTVGLLVREGVTISWTEQGTYTDGQGETAVVRDLHATNRVRFRTEARYGMTLTQPSALCVINLTN